MSTEKKEADAIEARRTSSDIFAKGQEIKQKLNKDSKDKGSEDLKKELTMTEHKVDLEDLIQTLGTNIEKGMTNLAVGKRRETEGLNKLTPPPEDPEWVKFMRTQTGFFSLLLWGGSILCFIGYGLKKEVDNLYLGIVLAFVVLVTGIFAYSQEKKSGDLMNSFKEMMTTQSRITRQGQSITIDATELVRGDIVKLKAGERVPADVRIINCTDDFKVDNSALTGENEPQSRSPNCTNENPLETKNLAFFGTLVPAGSCNAVVVNIGDKTVMGRIAILTTSTENDQTPINKEIEHFVKIVSAVAIFLGITFFLIGVGLNVDWITNLVFMIGIIVANVPEGLLATVTVCLTLTAKRMYTKKVMVKNLEAVETLGSTTCICSDKTGTLTQNIMTVANVVYDQKIWNVPCSLYSETTELKPNLPAEPLEDPTFSALLRVCSVANSAVFENKYKRHTVLRDGVKVTEDDLESPIPFEEEITLGDGSTMTKVQWTTNGDASESAMIKFAQRYKDILENRDENPELKTLPFNSTNKFMLTINKIYGDDSGDVQLLMKGAPERIMNRCDKILLNGEVVEYTAEMQKETEELQAELSRQGRRVLGLCQTRLPAEDYPADYQYDIENYNFPMGDDEAAVNWEARPTPNRRRCGKMTFVGLMALIDPPRPQVPPAVAKCKSAGIKVVMVTGDHPETAKAIAKEVGIIWDDTREDRIFKNEKNGWREGDGKWLDPDLAPAIVVPGWTINNTDTTEEVWNDILDHQQIVFARTSPQQKLIIVENFQRRKEVVAVTGDGVNDAPALKKADIGVAMGIMGSDVSKEAADMILLDDNFASIVSGVEEGRLIFDNLKKSIAYTLSSNIPEISPFLAFIVIQIPLPLSTILILCVDLGTDMVPAISMAWEGAEADIMKRRPRNSEVDHLVTKKLVVFAYLQIGVIQAASGFFAWLTVLNDYGYPPAILPGLGANDAWGKQMLFCQLKNGVMRNQVGDGLKVTGDLTYATFKTFVKQDFIFWDPDATGVAGAVAGSVIDCAHAYRDFTGTTSQPGGWTSGKFLSTPEYTAGYSISSVQAYAAMHEKGFVEYLPFRSRKSNFFNKLWLDVSSTYASNGAIPGVSANNIFPELFFTVQPPAFYQLSGAPSGDAVTGVEKQKKIAAACLNAAVCAGSPTKMYKAATAVVPVNSSVEVNGVMSKLYAWKDAAGDTRLNVASRMMQAEALRHAQTAGFICIIVVQWADLTICKTRWLSIRDQGMRNPAMNFGLLFETLLGAFLCYSPVNVALGTRPLRLTHWFPGMPFSVLIFLYDETRKALMRKTSIPVKDEKTGREYRIPGWLERNTYY